MTVFTQALRRVIRRGDRASNPMPPTAGAATLAQAPSVEIGDQDPLLAYLQSVSGPVDLDTLTLESPAVHALRDAGVKLVVPLIS